MNTDGRALEAAGRSLSFRGRAAVGLGRVAFAVARFRSSGGTSMPGKLALSIDPQVIAGLAGPLTGRVLAVTGTNGKTTTARIVSHLLRNCGFSVLANDSGANIPSGVATTLLKRRVQGVPDVAVMETDEKALPAISRDLRPRVTVVTNLMRDQLDRAGEPEIIAKGLRGAFAALPEASSLVLNADDPMVTALARGFGGRVVYYGMASAPEGASKSQVVDTRWCPECGAPLVYSLAFYAHLGHYACSECAFARPEPEVAAVSWDSTEAGGVLHMTVNDGEPKEFPVAFGGLYNAYNALAAAAALYAWDPTLLEVGPGLNAPSEIQAFGRMEWLDAGDKRILLNLIKNPTGAGEAIGLVSDVVAAQGPAGAALFALNDLAADGRDVSWIWDAPFEPLEGILQGGPAICSGTRAGDAAIRLKYAGIGAERIAVNQDLAGALDTALGKLEPGGVLVCLATYTALLSLRSVLVKRGWVRPFWEV